MPSNMLCGINRRRQYTPFSVRDRPALRKVFVVLYQNATQVHTLALCRFC